MKSQVVGLIVLLLIEGFYFANGEEYSVDVSVERYKLVTVSGFGVQETIVIEEGLQNYIVADDHVLAVADRLYSDTPNTLIVLNSDDCERRTYDHGKLVSTEPQGRDVCQEVKRSIRKAFLGEDKNASDLSEYQTAEGNY